MRILLVALLAHCLALASISAHAEENGLLLIDVQVQIVDSIDRDPGDIGGGTTDGFWVRNLNTDTTYGGMVLGNTMVMLEVPEGIYCLDSASAGGHNIRLNLCTEPYFRVVPGRLNNAGRWRIGFRVRTSEMRRYGSLEDLPGVLASARREFPERFNPPK
ncbi:hypothetical protein [Actimicrobium sp. GrIS 1.19]|uniref:hypothetical protein n=1 Tax=Actimicrobium sp. GrIS 1.19 TaxID=3071708 RepID=UPI002E13E7B6